MNQPPYPDPATVLLPRAIEAALRGGRVMTRLFTRGISAATKSGRHDYVTEADRTAEEYIIDCLRSRFPGHAFLGEESGSSGGDGDEVCWVVDPLDGTMNFVRHIPFFAVSIAAQWGEVGLCGVVYNPITDALFTSHLGGGATLNGEPLKMTATARVGDSILGIGLPHEPERKKNEMAACVSQVLAQGATFMRLGSSALNLAYVAAGYLDGFWELSYEPWDVAAGVQLVREAGGVVSNLDGSPFSPGNGIVAANPALHGELCQRLREGIDMSVNSSSRGAK